MVIEEYQDEELGSSISPKPDGRGVGQRYESGTISFSRRMS